jgi:predicted dehydrogenase
MIHAGACGERDDENSCSGLRLDWAPPRSNLRALNCDVVAFDPVDAARAAAKDGGIFVTGDLEEVWRTRPAAVIVAAPSNLHTQLALEAARHDCDVFIEKPLSHSLQGVEELCEEAESRDLTTMVACNMRFHPGPATVHRLMREGAVGETIALRLQTGSFLPRWRPASDYKNSYSASQEWGGAVLDCIHEIDLALWLGGAPRLVGALCVPAHALGLETDGLCEMILHHESGACGSVHLNFVQRDYRRTCQIIGTQGTIYWDFNLRRVDVMGPDGTLAQRVDEPDGWQINDMYVDEMKHFLECVDTRIATVNPLRGGLESLRIALQVRDGNTKNQGESAT